MLELVKKYQADIVLVLALISIAVISYKLGRISVLRSLQQPISAAGDVTSQ